VTISVDEKARSSPASHRCIFPRCSNGSRSLVPILGQRLSEQCINSFERWMLPLLVRHRHHLASLTVEFLDLSLGPLSGATVKMTDDSPAFFRTKSQELLAGVGAHRKPNKFEQRPVV